MYAFYMHQHHTYTHILGTHASFPVIPMLQWCFPGETLDPVPRRSTPIDFSVRVALWTFLFVLVFLVHICIENQGWAHFNALLTPANPLAEFAPIGAGIR